MRATHRHAFTGIAAALAIALAAGTAAAQDTTQTGQTRQPGQSPEATEAHDMPGQGGATDTAGYSGMERNDPAGARAGGGRVDTAAPARETETGQAAGQAGGAAGAGGDPNGFRWTEPSELSRSAPPVVPGAAATGREQTDRAGQPGRETEMRDMPGQGGAADTAGYSGMERLEGGVKDTSAGDQGAKPSPPADSTKQQ
ncbi:MAG TPA: hypothetical protein VFU46_08670 [Gemmatimonadales bacterium]|nr:hypothetical protein [Gemmatimonadales bacterium]